MRRLAHNPQLTPVGLGSGLADFQAYASSDPNFASAWGDIQTQLSAEGADATAVNAAKGALADAFGQMSQSLGVNPDDALQAAKQYVIAGQTVAGAIGHVQGLIAAAESGAPAPVVAQAFIGTMIGAAVAAGAVSAGTGAVIVAAVGAVLNILQSVGLFGTQPTGTTICPGVVVQQTPDWVYNCVGFYGSTVGPGSPNWRNFPDITNPADFAQWYGCPASVNNWGPAGAPLNTSYSCVSSYPDNVPVALAVFFELNHLLCENGQMPGLTNRSVVIPGLVEFQQMFFAAWKSNRAYALNGLKPQPDWMVLLHTARLWNRAHTGAARTGVYSLPAAPTNIGVSYFQGPFPTVPYEAFVLRDLVNTGSYTDVVQNGALQLAIPKRPAMSLVPIRTSGMNQAPIATAGMSTGAKVATGVAVTAGATAAGIGLYALLGNMTFGYAAGKVFDKAIEGIKAIGRRVQGK